MLVQLCCTLALVVSMTTASSPVLAPISLAEAFEHPPLPPEIKTERMQVMESFHVLTDIRYRFATTQMSSVVRNINNKSEEVGFHVTLPKDAFIVQFHMMIDGERYDGEVKERQAAKRQYQEAVERGQSAGHVRQTPRHANMFEVSVNVAAGSAVNFTLTYQEMLRRRLGVYEHEVHVNPGQPVRDFRIETRIQENRPLRFVRTPALRTDYLLTNKVGGEELNDLTVVDRPTPETATVLYQPSLEQQGKAEGLQARFVVQYDVEHGGPGGDVLVVDGYFVHFLAPDHIHQTLPKDIIFVLDVSGSMSGEKINQLRVAMVTILSDLMPQDRLNIITFSSGVKRWKEGLVSADEATIKEAKAHVLHMTASGMTNINDALLQALSEMRGRLDKDRVGMIFFLTDGIPTEGETDPKKIASNVANANGGHVAIFSLAFGDGADYDSLKSISAQNLGFARKIYEASDAALQVASLYNEISAVSIKDMSITYQNSSVDEFSLTKTDFPIVFNGSEIMICGLLEDTTATLKYEIKGLESSGEIDLEVRDLEPTVLGPPTKKQTLFSGPRDYAGIVERMWAFITVKQLLKQKEKESGIASKVESLNKEILAMSLKYKLVTPLTSMVVTKPDKNETKEPVVPRVIPKSLGMMSKQAFSPNQMPSRAYGSMLPLPPNSASFQPSYISRHGRKGPVAMLDPLGLPHVSGGLAFSKTTQRTSTTTTTTTSSPTTTASPTTAPAPVKYSVLQLVTLTLPENKTNVHTPPIVCAVPKRWKFGNVLLYSDHNLTRVTLKQCSRRECRKQPSIKTLQFEFGRDVTTVQVGGSPNWLYGLGRTFSVEVLSNSVIEVTGHSLHAIISVFWRDNVSYYGLRLLTPTTDSSHYGGLMGDLASKPTDTLHRWSKKRAQRVCKSEKAQFSVIISRKKAKMFRVRRRRARRGRKNRGNRHSH